MQTWTSTVRRQHANVARICPNQSPASYASQSCDEAPKFLLRMRAVVRSQSIISISHYPVRGFRTICKGAAESHHPIGGYSHDNSRQSRKLHNSIEQRRLLAYTNPEVTAWELSDLHSGTCPSMHIDNTSAFPCIGGLQKPMLHRSIHLDPSTP